VDFPGSEGQRGCRDFASQPFILGMRNREIFIALPGFDVLFDLADIKSL